LHAHSVRSLRPEPSHAASVYCDVALHVTQSAQEVAPPAATSMYVLPEHGSAEAEAAKRSKSSSIVAARPVSGGRGMRGRKKKEASVLKREGSSLLMKGLE